MFKPLQNRVLVKRAKAETKTASGIYIPEIASQKSQEAEVIEVGPGIIKDGVLVPVNVKVGDRILLGKWSGNEIKINNEDYLVIVDTDILGILI